MTKKSIEWQNDNIRSNKEWQTVNEGWKLTSKSNKEWQRVTKKVLNFAIFTIDVLSCVLLM